MLAINMNDVINTINSAKNQLIFFGVVVALAVIALIVSFAAKKLSKSKKYMIRAQAGVAVLAALAITINLVCFGPMSTLISLATGSGSISEESGSEAIELCSEIANEGMVLLKNDGTLPVTTDTKLNVFGWSSTNPVYGGTGSGSMSDKYDNVTLMESLVDAGFTVNTELEQFYTGYRATRPTVGMWGQDWTIPEPTIEEYEAAGVFQQAKEFSDTALIVISRSGGEGADLPTSLDPALEDTFVEGGGFGSSGLRMSANTDDLDASKHYLELTNREAAMVERVTAEFDRVIVIVNAANAMELGWAKNNDNINALIWTAGPGQTGFSALGKILSGEVNPSGKTVDTFLADLTAAPWYNNFGDILYTNMDDLAYVSTDWRSGAQITTTPRFVNYVEGIYVGYKFYETAYADGMEGFDYDKAVVYPFGYGLSYTTFTQKIDSMTEADGTITLDVTVTNTGSAAGKDVVQVYYNPPYTNGGIEKSAVNLAAFDKTGLLEPGASETLTLTFNAEDMASFDTYGAGCYVLEKGDYVISINADAHTVLDSATYTVDATVTYNESNPRSTDAEAATVKMSDAEGTVTYLSRADGFANYAAATAAPASTELSAEGKASFLNNVNYDPANFNNADDEMPATGVKNGLKLESMRGVAYDDAQWDTFMDQLTVAEMDTLIARGGYSTAPVESIGKVQTTDCDGPASINNNFTGVSSIGFPAATMIAATWNTDLAKAFGESIGKMADEMDVSGWYAPAMNIHRSAFAGRNFEYYSEDSFLSGIMASAAIQGAETYGVYSYMKHFALNDQENGRGDMLCTWSNEQAAREIYLKPFELSVKVGGADAAMSSFNYIGTIWAGSYYPVQTEILRGEWGFRGMVVTDYFGGGAYMDSDQAIRGGTDFCLSPNDVDTNHVTDTTSATSVKAMRQAAKNILYTTVNSRAYAPENLNPGMPGWQVTAIVVDVLVALALLALEWFVIRKAYLKRKAQETV